MAECMIPRSGSRLFINLRSEPGEGAAKAALTAEQLEAAHDSDGFPLIANMMQASHSGHGTLQKQRGESYKGERLLRGLNPVCRKVLLPNIPRAYLTRSM